MKFVRVTLPRDEGKLAQFLEMDDILIHSRHFYPTDPEHFSGIIFYDEISALDERKEDEEAERLADLLIQAHGIQNDLGYRELKNTNQRSIWLLSKYGISGRDALDIQELLKPEMAEILKGAAQEGSG